MVPKGRWNDYMERRYSGQMKQERSRVKYVWRPERSGSGVDLRMEVDMGGAGKGKGRDIMDLKEDDM